MIRPKFPAYDYSLVIRTDFLDDAVWNLRLANMAFEDFANSLDSDGTFRGFPGAPA